MSSAPRPPRPLRALLAVVGLLVVSGILCNALGDYQQRRMGEADAGGSSDSSATPSTEATPQSGTPTETGAGTPAAEGEAAVDEVVVAIDGLNFRREARANGPVIRGLDAGERLKLLEKVSGWYRVRDASGVEGWVSSNPEYTTLSER